MDIRVDEEFRALIPPLDPQERAQLEENIKADGVREPLVVWVLPQWKPEGAVEPLDFRDFMWRRYEDQSIRCWQFATERGEALEVTEDEWPAILVDGHNRHEIASRLDLKTNETEKYFENRGEAIEWMIRNQFGRRNLPAVVRVKLALRLEEEIASRAKQRKTEGQRSGGRGRKNLVQNSAPSYDEGKTRDQVAQLANVSHDTVAKVKAIYQALEEQVITPQVVQELERGETSINAVHGKVKRSRGDKPSAKPKPKAKPQTEEKQKDRAAKLLALVRQKVAEAVAMVADESAETRAIVIEMLEKAVEDLKHE